MDKPNGQKKVPRGTIERTKLVEVKVFFAPDELAAFDAYLSPYGGKRATYLREHVRSIIAAGKVSVNVEATVSGEPFVVKGFTGGQS